MADHNMNFFGEDAEFDHAGIAVRSINRIASGLEIIEDPLQKVHVAFIDLNGLRVELICPAGENSPISAILAKGQHLYHLCYRVNNLNSSLKIARNHGLHCIAKPVPAMAFGNKRIVWVYSSDLGLFELLEK